MSRKLPRSLRLLAFVIAIALVVGVGSALAARGDPQKNLTPADNARARTMLLKKSDLGPGFKAKRSSGDFDYYCEALDESDLTLTGEAESPDFQLGLTFVSAGAQLYQSVADSNTSWRRGISPAGEACARDVLRREFAKQGIRLDSVQRLAFPRVSARTIAYRISLSAQSQGLTVLFVMDLVVLMHSRAQVGLVFGSALATGVPRAQEVKLARLTAKRMATAMRGS